jgi:L-ascorbate metabolism protein UlaG (beta-lactamase superfamily)
LNLQSAWLDPTVKLEPLVDRWYAWPHLLAPAQQALNLEFRYLPIVRSFLASPAVHVAASSDPNLYGGPFLDLPLTAVDVAKDYLADTERRRSDALEFARALRKFDALLQAATGFSLEEYRAKIPPPLNGLLELVYDLNNHPKLRILEEMLEGVELGFSDAQEILVHRQHDTQRSFFLSTPRLQVEGALFLRTPFGSTAAQMLCAARTEPIDLRELAALLGESVERLAPYFVEQCPAAGRDSPQAAGVKDGGVRVRYFGHACLLIETADVSILVDPVVANDRLAQVTHFTFADLPRRIDFLFLSHGHQDHFCPEILMQLRDRVGAVLIPPHNHGDLSDPSLRRILKSLGFRTVVTLEPLESIPLTDGALTALPFSGEHSDLDVHSKQCALIELRGRRICLFIDTDAIDIDVYRRLERRLARPDMMFIGMECSGAPLSWLYGPLATRLISKKNDNSRRLSGANCARAWRLAEMLQPRTVHVYAMGQEPWMRSLMGLQYAEDSIQLRESANFIECCRSHGIMAQRLYQHMDTVL